MKRNLFSRTNAGISKKSISIKSGINGARSARLTLSCAAAAVFFIAAAIAFFACKEDNQSNNPRSTAETEQTSQTELHNAQQEDGRKADTFESGTLVVGTDIGGLDTADAAAMLKSDVERLVSEYECVLVHGEKRFTLNKNDLTLETDLEEVLAKARKNGKGEYFIAVWPSNDRRLSDAVDAISEIIDAKPQGAELLSISAAKELNTDELERNSRFVVTAPTDGAKLDKAAAKELVLSGVRMAELPVETLKANSTVPILPVRRAVFSTSYNSPSLSASGRVHNIKKGAALMNARSLAPGETLSCNEVLGERTKENGWQTGTAFASGGKKTEQQYGGGICQISTTLYNCALMAGLEVPERIGHSRKVAYIEGGRDASLSWGSADLVIKNSTEETVYIFMWTDDEKSCLSCEIYGGSFPDEYDEIAILSELIEVIEPSEPEFITDDSLKDGECVRIRDAIRGRVYQTYAEYRRNGAAVRREEIAKTPYPMIPALYAVPKPKE
jgi:vancomycin resistance protein YoaR